MSRVCRTASSNLVQPELMTMSLHTHTHTHAVYIFLFVLMCATTTRFGFMPTVWLFLSSSAHHILACRKCNERTQQWVEFNVYAEGKPTKLVSGTECHTK